MSLFLLPLMQRYCPLNNLSLGNTTDLIIAHIFRLGHDNDSLQEPGWHVDHVKVWSQKLNKTWVFNCKSWIRHGQYDVEVTADGLLEKTLFPEGKGWVREFHDICPSYSLES